MPSEKMKRAVEEWKRRILELEQQVAEQTADLRQKNRELEIEAATQKVRAVAMGMQQPDDIMKVLSVMKEEVDKFDLGNIATWIWTKDEDGLIAQWDIPEVIEEGNLVNFNLRFDIHKNPEVNRHTKEWEKGKKYYELHWRGEKLQAVVDKVAKIDPENGKIFQQAVDVGQIEDLWHAASPFSQVVVGLDFTSAPPEITESILSKMASAFDIAYQRFKDLQKADAQTMEAQINLAVERVRARALAMFESEEILEVVKKLRDEIMGLDIPNVVAATIHLREPDGMCRVWDLTSLNIEKGDIHQSLDIRFRLEDTPPGFFMRRVWENDSDYFVVIQEKADFKHTIQWLRDNGLQEQANDSSDFFQSSRLERAYHPTVPLNNGRMCIDMLEPPDPKMESILKKMAGAFDLAYKRFEDLKKSEQQSYESKVEASLERVRGMAAAMNHSDDLMQIAEAMFKELEILRINPLRYGLAMIDREKKEAELWASTVNDGHYLDMLGTLSLTWHPMLVKVLDAWNSQHEEVIYELKGEELSNYYRKIGQINPDIPELEKLQDPETDTVQFVSFFPFKTGTLYAFTNGEPGEDGKSILKRFASVFEQAHIRYEDLQTAEKQARLIREERDRLEIALKELKATQDQLVQQEKLASLGALTAGIAHEIKNPLNFVNNFSELSVELVEEAREEIRRVTEDPGPEYPESKKGKTPLLGGAGGGSEKAENTDQSQNPESESNIANPPFSPSDSRRREFSKSDSSPLLDIIDDIEANLKTIHKHGTRADSIVKSMLQHSRGGDGTMEPTALNPLIKEYVNLAFHGMRAGKDPINVDIDLQLDDSVGEVQLIAEDFSRVILNICNNGFDAMREKGIKNSELKIKNYSPKLTVRTKAENGNVAVEIQDNGPGIPEDMKDKIMQPFFTTKKGTAGTGLGLSITNDIIKAHGGNLDIESGAAGSLFKINLPL